MSLQVGLVPQECPLAADCMPVSPDSYLGARVVARPRKLRWPDAQSRNGCSGDLGGKLRKDVFERMLKRHVPGQRLGATIRMTWCGAGLRGSQARFLWSGSRGWYQPLDRRKSPNLRGHPTALDAALHPRRSPPSDPFDGRGLGVRLRGDGNSRRRFIALAASRSPA